MDKMDKKVLIGWSVAVAVWLGERGLGVSGYHNIPLAIALWGFSACALSLPIIMWMMPQKWKLFPFRYYVACAVAAIIFTVSAYSIGKASGEHISDPEDARNKFVRITRIDPSLVGAGDRTRAYLIEFGIVQEWSEGYWMKFRVPQPLSHLESWIGDSGQTHRQQLSRAIDVDRYQGLLEIEEGFSGVTLTPNRSAYYYFEFDAVEDFDPSAILFIAVHKNANRPADERDEIGKQYERLFD